MRIQPKVLCSALALAVVAAGCDSGPKNAPPPAVVPAAPGGGVQKQNASDKTKPGPGGAGVSAANKAE